MVEYMGNEILNGVKWFQILNHKHDSPGDLLCDVDNSRPVCYVPQTKQGGGFLGPSKPPFHELYRGL